MVKYLYCVNSVCVDRHLSQLLQCSVQLLMCLSVGYDMAKHAIYK